MPFIRRLAHSVMPSTDHTLGLGNSKSAMAAVNAMKRRQMAMWSPRNDKGGEGNATMTPEERLQHEIAVNDAIVDVFSAIIKETPRTLADSRHAPKNAKTTPSAKAKQNIHATGDNHKHNDSECTHKEHYYPIPEYAHTGEYEHDFHLSTATDKRELSPHSKKLRDEAFQRVCSGFTEGERFAHPPARGRQPSTPASSDKATATSSSIPTSKEVKIENVPPMIASSEPKPISDPMKLTRESKKTSENPKSAKASPLTTKLPSEKPVQAEGVRSGLNKSDTSSASLSTQKPETMTADEEYVPPHIRHLRRVKPEVLSAETPHGASKPTSRKASLPSSPKLDSSNTAGVSGEALPPHLRTVKHQNVGIKPKYSSTSSVSSLLGNVRKPEVKKQPLAAMPAEPVIPISTNKPSMEPSTKNTADVGTKPNSSWTSSPLGNASKPEVSQKPLAAMHAEPVIATPTSKSSTKSAADVGTKPTTSSTSSTSSSSSNARKFEVSQKPLDAVPVKPAILAPTNKPSTEPSTKKATGAAPVKEENLEHALYFGAWPKLAGRDAAVSQVRKIIITKLPPDSKPSFVASLVYGGPLEEIYMIGTTTASVMFLDPEDCARYNAATANGIVYGKDQASGRELVAFTEMSKDVNVIGGLLKGFIEAGVTRCVKCIGVEEDWSLAALTKMAERKNRKLEGIEEMETRGGARAVTFRFCKVADAVAFNGVLRRDEEFEQCNTMYSTDPCAIATDVHFDE